MAVSMAALGGIAIVHYNNTPSDQYSIIRSAKSRHIPFASNPIFKSPSDFIDSGDDFTSSPCGWGLYGGGGGGGVFEVRFRSSGELSGMKRGGFGAVGGRGGWGGGGCVQCGGCGEDSGVSEAGAAVVGGRWAAWATLLTGSILAHELMHGWLRLKGKLQLICLKILELQLALNDWTKSSVDEDAKEKLAPYSALSGDESYSNRDLERTETEYNNSVSDPFLIRDGSETECINSVSVPSLISNGSETECNYNCTI
ncbi:hypothetical protein Scep_009811 [Stephania cephalantha]|uniref:Protein DA1-like domain-containing protein n=1 Tax=Stephania cephalantha TaxID=152367 RepID=A0AAP0JW47_9MAGN